MHAYLIHGGTDESRRAKVDKFTKESQIHEVDQLFTKTDEKSIGIKEVREAMSRLQLTPIRSKAKAWIILNGEILTQEAQQAILKTLEEPPAKTLIYICSESRDSLLPTIQSRCLAISLDNEKPISPRDEDEELFQKLTGPRREALEYLDNIEKEAVRPWVKRAINRLHNAIINEPANTNYGKLIKLLFLAQKQLSVNVNHKLVLTQLIYQNELLSE